MHLQKFAEIRVVFSPFGLKGHAGTTVNDPEDNGVHALGVGSSSRERSGFSSHEFETPQETKPPKKRGLSADFPSNQLLKSCLKDRV